MYMAFWRYSHITKTEQYIFVNIFSSLYMLYTLSNEAIQIWASREIMSPKKVNILRLTCKTPIPKVTISHKIVNKIFKIWHSYSPVLVIFSISVPNFVTIRRHLTSLWRVRRSTYLKKAYTHISIFLASKVGPPKGCVIAYSRGHLIVYSI